MYRLSTWPYLFSLACLIVLAFPAAGASGDTFPGVLDASFGVTWPGVTSVAPPCLSYQQFDPVGGGLQRDGKTVLVGACDDGNFSQEVLVVRLASNGHLDPSFNGDGFVIAQLGLGPGPHSVSDSVALQPDGKILVGGSVTSPLGPWVPPEFTVWRLNGDGSFDSTFGIGGTVTASLPGVSALVLQPDGKIIAGGDDFIARLNPDGSFDSSFASGGVLIEQGANVAALALQSDGKIVAAGSAPDQANATAFLVFRLSPRGSMDPSFGSNGIFLDQLGTGQSLHSWATSVVLQPDDKVVVGGIWTNPGYFRPVVARLDGTGHLDSSFGSAGIVTDEWAGALYGQSSVQALAVQPNGKVLVAGGPPYAGDTEGAVMLRLQPDGRPDMSFGRGGVIDLPYGNSQFTTMAVQANGKVLAAGTILLNAVARLFAARFIVDLPPSAAFNISPTQPTLGQTVTFNSSGSSDTDGSINGYAWRLGDGGTSTGKKPTHTYARPGSYTVTLTVTDDYGLTNSVSHTIKVVRPPSPVLTLLRLRPYTFETAAHGASIATRGGTTVSYRDSLAAKTRFTVNRILAGKVRGTVRGSFIHQDRKGANSFHFTGRVGSQRLRPGSYRLNATPTTSGRTGTTIHIKFRITR
jgi:uncharacterized delta-60 repeat protein